MGRILTVGLKALAVWAATLQNDKLRWHDIIMLPAYHGFAVLDIFLFKKKLPIEV